MPFKNGKIVRHQMTVEKAKMLDRGYMLATDLARQLGKTSVTIYGWINDGHVRHVSVAKHRYVEINTVIDHLGESAAKMFGLTRWRAKRGEPDPLKAIPQESLPDPDGEE